MAQRIVFYLLLFLPFHSYSQRHDGYIKTVDSLYAIIQQFPSFKDQIKGSKLISYDSLVNAAKKDTFGISSDYDVFLRLVKILFPLKDNHIGLYHPETAILDPAAFNDSVAVNNYRATKSFRQFPSVKLNIDSLEAALKNKPTNGIEGFYYFDSTFKIGLYETNESGKYQGIVLSTSLPNWVPGQIAVTLFEYQPGFFHAVYAHLRDKALIWYPNEKFVNKSLIQFGYRKDPDTPDYSVGNAKLVYQLTYINSSLQNLKLGSFSASPENIKHAQDFFKSIKDSLTASKLIVDLRGNTGGAYNVSLNFFNLLKRYSEKGKIVALINFFTMSEGERFVLRLKSLKNVVLAGQTTMGTIAYGSNRGEWRPFAGGKYFIYPTDMNDPDHFISYENVGVKPDVLLGIDKDWIKQAEQIIK